MQARRGDDGRERLASRPAVRRPALFRTRPAEGATRRETPPGEPRPLPSPADRASTIAVRRVGAQPPEGPVSDGLAEMRFSVRLPTGRWQCLRCRRHRVELRNLRDSPHRQPLIRSECDVPWGQAEWRNRTPSSELHRPTTSRVAVVFTPNRCCLRASSRRAYPSSTYDGSISTPMELRPA